MSSGSTVASIARALADALHPLSSALDPVQVSALFEDLGLGLPPAALADGTFGEALAEVRAAAAELPDLVARLTGAIAGDDPSATTLLEVEAIGKIGGLRSKLAGIGTALTGLAPAFPTVPAAELAAFVDELPRRVLDLLAVSRLEAEKPGLVNGLALVGLIERHQNPGVPGDPAHPPFEVRRLRIDRLPSLLQAPADHFRALYGWGDPSFDGRALLAQIADATLHSGLPTVITTGPDGRPLLDLLVGTLTTANAPGAGVRAELRFGLPGGQTIDVPLPAAGWRLRLIAEPPLPAGVAAVVSAPASVSIAPAGPEPIAGDLSAELVRTPTPPDTQVLIVGEAGGTRLEAASIRLRVGARLSWDAALGAGIASAAAEISITGGRLVLDLRSAGSLVGALVPADAVRGEFDMALDWSNGEIHLRGSVGLSASFPVHASIGPVELTAIVVGVQPGAGGVPVEISATVAAALGPLSVLIERMGVIVEITFPNGGGNLGPLDVGFAFKAPSGLGISLDAGPVQGGGYLSVDPAAHRYAGVLQFKLTFIGITAYGIYEEAPGGGASFVGVLGVRFFPGIQLGFGFALTGVGGLVGYNRRADADLLRDRLAGGAAGAVLFCDDPVKNAPTLLGDLAALFPPAAGTFIVGPTLQLSWAPPIVRLDVAVLIELPGPSKIVVLGSIKVMIGANETLALLYLRMDFLGIIDFEGRMISLDACLVNSHALGVFRLTGGMALRLSYGDNPYILLSIGGFNARFDPGPLNLPALARVGAVMNSGALSPMYLRLEMYVAFTSNTLQLGAKVEAGMELGPIHAHGYLQFDALIQFRPFSFDIEFSAGFAVEVFDVSLCSVDVHGRLTGPGPLIIHAEARVRLLFIKVSGSATVELGGHDGDGVQPVPDLLAAMAPELSRPANVRTEGEDRTVVLHPHAQVTGALLSPKGMLIWEQKRVPLRTTVDRFEGAPLGGPHWLDVLADARWSVTPETDWFSPGMFTSFDLKASQSLNNAAFQELSSGKRFGGAKQTMAPTDVPYTPHIDLIKRPTRVTLGAFVGSYLTSKLADFLHERDTTPPISPGPPVVTVATETFILEADDATSGIGPMSPFEAFQMSRARPGTFAVPTADPVVPV